MLDVIRTAGISQAESAKMVLK